MKHKIFTLLFVTTLIYTHNFAQPVLKIQSAAGGKYNDYLKSICITKDGGWIAGGHSESNASGDKTEDRRSSFPFNDYWIVKFDKGGNIQWDKTIGGSGAEAFAALQQTTDGGYILGGSSASNISFEKSENSKGSGDYWIVKLDSSGNIQWDKTIGGSGGDQLATLQQTTDGGYILGGSSTSETSFDKSADSRDNDYWIVKLDSAGNIQWDKTIGGNGYDELSSLQQTNDDGYICGGSSRSGKSHNKTEESRGNDDYWIVKLDKNGNIQWDKTIGGSDNDNLSSLQQTKGGEYILGGTSTSGISGEKTQNSIGVDYWIVKLDSSGKVRWDKTIGTANDDFFSSLQQTKDLGYILGGEARLGASGDKTEDGRGEWDFWIVKLDKNGNIRWDKTIGGSDDDQLVSVKEIRRNHYLIGGYSKSLVSGDKIVQTRGRSRYDYWMVKLVYHPVNNSIATALPDEIQPVTSEHKISSFVIYPNPVKNVLHIQMKGTAIFSLTDGLGKTLLTKTITGSASINVANLKAGMYYLQNRTTGETQKVIVSD